MWFVCSDLKARCSRPWLMLVMRWPAEKATESVRESEVNRVCGCARGVIVAVEHMNASLPVDCVVLVRVRKNVVT